MAEELTIQGADVKIRHPWGVWGLSIITLGIYGLVWWYKINREMRDYSAAIGQPLDNNPTNSVLALFPGGYIIVPAIWTQWTTPQRVADTQEMSGSQDRVVPLLSLLLAVFVFALHTVYLQSALNGVWRTARDEGAPTSIQSRRTRPPALWPGRWHPSGDDAAGGRCPIASGWPSVLKSPGTPDETETEAEARRRRR